MGITVKKKPSNIKKGITPGERPGLGNLEESSLKTKDSLEFMSMSAGLSLKAFDPEGGPNRENGCMGREAGESEKESI